MNQLVSTQWLNNNLNKENIVILDCSWFLPSDNRNSEIDYKKGHIMGSHFFDINKISDKKNKLPHMVPDIKHFTNSVKYFNIQKKTKIINYSSENLMGASRVWWMFKYFGFNNVYILNGGFNKWLNEKRLITNKISVKKKSSYIFNIDDTWMANKDTILNNLKSKKKLVIDARNKERFNGKVKELRKGLRSGHIPNSKNLFWKDLTNNGEKMQSKKTIKKIFKRYNIGKRNVILSCGSGVSACVLSLSLMHGLDIKGSVYDGSWTEWGSSKKLPIKK